MKLEIQSHILLVTLRIDSEIGNAISKHNNTNVKEHKWYS